ncbi:twin-arginine translocase TatA/TatE family subunit [Leifsonia aquatica]|jgi:sec-independent protein translocase protein TatA|uniref:Sec-independent protein translocase protein TatA n=1 Tax=Leifsonia aquatica TaxID=144185 RepID=A0A7W4YK88_LEIAQ|nr:sec-independent protein translocase protein TatA [Leifsonia aquatica]
MFANLNGWHALIIVAIILLLFGAPKIPALAKSLGQSMRIFKNEVKPELGGRDETPETPAPAASER